ncbi:MAG: LemA family protein [Candidatus Marsarchaeota archaeon]|jgi:LemA protein|nr:LemA family protein [Candidatus Marsarchaeota archaeon]
MLLEIIIGVIILIIVAAFVLIYNSLVVLNNDVNKNWKNIDVLLQKRHDMLGKLIDSVSGYMKYEKGVMTNITKLRSAWETVPQNNIQAKMDTSNQITGALKTLFAVMENYPDLKADNNVMQLQQSITDIENQLADQRELYNNSVNNFNIKIQQFPSDIVASFMHYNAKQMFNVAEEEKQDVKVSFDQ